MHGTVGLVCVCPVISEIVERPPVSLALPTQSTLLRGVVRIEQKKAGYLLEDAEKATARGIEQLAARERTTAPINKIKAMSADNNTIRLIPPCAGCLKVSLVCRANSFLLKFVSCIWICCSSLCAAKRR